MAGYYLVLILSWIITIAIAFIVIRKATRADEQAATLKAIANQQDILIKILSTNGSVDASVVGKVDTNTKEPKTEEEYLEEARRKAGLI